MTSVLNDDNALKEFAAVDLERTWAFASQVRDEIDLEPRLDEIERLYRHVNRTHDPLLDRAARSAWAADVERVAHAYAGRHLMHWRSVAAAADAADQSALF